MSRSLFYLLLHTFPTIWHFSFIRLENIDPGLVNIWGSGGFNMINLISIIGLVSIGIGFMGSPQVYVRFIAIENTDEIEKGKWVAVLYTLLTDTAAVMIGMMGRYLLTDSGQDAELVLGPAGENVLSLLLGQVMPTIIIGIYIAAVLSAVMSTVDSLLVVASSAVTRDFYQQILHPDVDQKWLIGFSKKVTLGLALLALGVALTVSYFLQTGPFSGLLYLDGLELRRHSAL